MNKLTPEQRLLATQVQIILVSQVLRHGSLMDCMAWFDGLSEHLHGTQIGSACLFMAICQIYMHAC